MLACRVYVYVLLGLCALAPQASADQNDTFNPYTSISYGYDSNLFRLANDSEALGVLGTTDTAERYRVLAAGINVDWRISRQTIRARAELSRTNYETYQVLDYDGRDLLLQWSWAVGSKASGDVGVSETRTLGSFSELQQVVNNIRTQRRQFANGAVKLDNRWQIKAAAARTELLNSSNAASQSSLDFSEDSLNLGVQYQTPKATLVELGSRFSNGTYPNRQIVGLTPVDNSYKQVEPGVGVTWLPTGKTRLQARLGYTRRTYDDVPQRNFSGATGRLSGDWYVSGKTAFNLAVYREIGAYEDTTASYTLNHGVALSGSWLPSAKTTLTLRAIHDQRSFDGDPDFIVSTDPVRQDKVNSLQASINYAVLRKVAVGLTLQAGERTSNRALQEYRYYSGMVNLRGEF